MNNSRDSIIHTRNTLLRVDHATFDLTSELQPTELESDKAIAKLNNVDKSIESVGGEDEEISRGHLPPPPQHQVPT